mgnify:FL=1
MNYHQVEFEAAFGTAGQIFESTVPEVCFAGRSNVGKSSLINKILNRKAFARTSQKPGKTITVNFYKLPGLRLVDLPGYGYAKISGAEKQRFAELMEGFFAQNRKITTVFSLIDMRHAPTADDLNMLHFLLQAGYPFHVVLTKCDKLKKTERERQRAALQDFLSFLPGEVKVIEFSAVTGEGCEQIKEIIEGIEDIAAAGNEH